jgi:hypothetical protein
VPAFSYLGIPPPNLPLIGGRNPADGLGGVLPQTGWVPPPFQGEARRGYSSFQPKLIPAPKSSRILHAITPHGRPAGERWWGEPGGGFASPTGPSAAPSGRTNLLRVPHCSKNRHPEAASVSCFYLLRGESRLGVRSLPAWACAHPFETAIQAALSLAPIKSHNRSLPRISSHGVSSSGTTSTGPPVPSFDVPINPPGSSSNPSIG